eukprot:3942919-Pyramimonas_sp.AAC.1
MSPPAPPPSHSSRARVCGTGAPLSEGQDDGWEAGGGRRIHDPRKGSGAPQRERHRCQADCPAAHRP